MYYLTLEIQNITDQIPSFRLFRAFIICRAFKIFRGFKYFEIISYVVQKSFYSFVSITFLILVFLVIFSLLGNQIFYNLLNDLEFKTSAKSFQTFMESFMSVLNIVTLDNYSDIFYVSWNKTNNFYLTFFFIAIIFVANMFLLNLFITILLDGFDKINEEAKEENLKQTFSNTIQSIYDEEDVSIESLSKNLSNNQSILSDNAQKSKTTKSLSLGVNDEKAVSTFKFDIKKGITFYDEAFYKIEEEYSLFLFSKTNIIRIVCFKIINNKIFSYSINVTIIFSIIYMALLTFAPTLDNSSTGFTVKIIINTILLFETLAIIINNGFIMRKKSFMRNFFNFFDVAVLIIFFLDVCTNAPDSINVNFIRLHKYLKFNFV